MSSIKPDIRSFANMFKNTTLAGGKIGRKE